MKRIEANARTVRELLQEAKFNIDFSQREFAWQKRVVNLRDRRKGRGPKGILSLRRACDASRPSGGKRFSRLTPTVGVGNFDFSNAMKPAVAGMRAGLKDLGRSLKSGSEGFGASRRFSLGGQRRRSIGLTKVRLAW